MILCSYFFCRYATYIPHARVCAQALLVLTVLLVSFDVPEVVDERTRTERSRSNTDSFVVSKLLRSIFQHSSLYLNLQHVVTEPSHIHL